MNIKQTISLINRERPTTPEEFAKTGIVFEKKTEGKGVFRRVLKVKGLPLVVKFPLAAVAHDRKRNKNMTYREGKLHSTTEVRKIQQLSKIRWMRRHLPKVYYHDRKSGVLVMHWYKEFSSDGLAIRSLGKLVTKLLQKHLKINVSDLHEENIRMGRSIKEAVLIDLGY